MQPICLRLFSLYIFRNMNRQSTQHKTFLHWLVWQCNEQQTSFCFKKEKTFLIKPSGASHNLVHHYRRSHGPQYRMHHEKAIETNNRLCKLFPQESKALDQLTSSIRNQYFVIISTLGTSNQQQPRLCSEGSGCVTRCCKQMLQLPGCNHNLVPWQG